MNKKETVCVWYVLGGFQARKKKKKKRTSSYAFSAFSARIL